MISAISPSKLACDASINALVNVSMIELIRTEDVFTYFKPKGEISEGHNFTIRESAYKGMERLREKYGLSIYRLTNVAIYNAIYKEIDD